MPAKPYRGSKRWTRRRDNRITLHKVLTKTINTLCVQWTYAPPERIHHQSISSENLTELIALTVKELESRDDCIPLNIIDMHVLLRMLREGKNPLHTFKKEKGLYFKNNPLLKKGSVAKDAYYACFTCNDQGYWMFQVYGAQFLNEEANGYKILCLKKS